MHAVVFFEVEYSKRTKVCALHSIATPPPHSIFDYLNCYTTHIELKSK
jgi:hypothetical protein